MPALLALIPTKDWVYLSLIMVIIGFTGYYTIHERHVGAAHEIAALKKSSDELQAKAAAHVALVAKAYATASTSNMETLNAQLKVASDRHDSDAQRLREYDAVARKARSFVIGQQAFFHINVIKMGNTLQLEFLHFRDQRNGHTA